MLVSTHPYLGWVPEYLHEYLGLKNTPGVELECRLSIINSVIALNRTAHHRLHHRLHHQPCRRMSLPSLPRYLDNL